MYPLNLNFFLQSHRLASNPTDLPSDSMNIVRGLIPSPRLSDPLTRFPRMMIVHPGPDPPQLFPTTQDLKGRAWVYSKRLQFLSHLVSGIRTSPMPPLAVTSTPFWLTAVPSRVHSRSQLRSTLPRFFKTTHMVRNSDFCTSSANR